MLLWMACVPKLYTVDAGHTRVPILEQAPVEALPQKGAVVTGSDDDDIAVALSWVGPITRFHPEMLITTAESQGFLVLGEPEPDEIFGHEGARLWVVANGLVGTLVGWVCPDTQRLYTHLVLSSRVRTTRRLNLTALDLVECHGHGDVSWRSVNVNAPEGWTRATGSVPNLETWRRPDDRETVQVKMHYSPLDLDDCDSLGEAWLTSYSQGAGLELFELGVKREDEACVGSALLPGFWEGGRVRMRVEECGPDELLVVFHTSVMGEETPGLLSAATCESSAQEE